MTFVIIFVVFFCSAFSSKFKIFHSSLYQPQYGFGAAIYEDVFYTINGRSATGSISKAYYTTLEDPFLWYSTTISYPSFNGTSATMVRISNQNQFSLNNILYIIKPFLGLSSVEHKTLLKYNLNTLQYLNPSAYDSISDLYERDPCVTYNPVLNVFYVIDGWNTKSSTAEIYDLTSDEWITDGIPLLEPRIASGCAMDRNSEYIYVFGGHYYEYKDTILKFDIYSNNWSVLSFPTLSNVVSKLKCLLFIDGNIYCVGGWNRSGTLLDVNIFNPSEETMDSSSYSLNTGRIGFALLQYKNCIYVAGGYDGGSSYFSDIEYLCIPEYDPCTAMCTEVCKIRDGGNYGWGN